MLYSQHSPTARSSVEAKLLDEHEAPVKRIAIKIADAIVRRITGRWMYDVTDVLQKIKVLYDITAIRARHAFQAVDRKKCLATM